MSSTLDQHTSTRHPADSIVPADVAARLRQRMTRPRRPNFSGPCDSGRPLPALPAADTIDALITAAAAAFMIAARDIRTRRTPRAVEARGAVMWTASTILGMGNREIARRFGCDRTTAYARIDTFAEATADTATRARLAAMLEMFRKRRSAAVGTGQPRSSPGASVAQCQPRKGSAP